ncbi:hypothetical protein [Raineyella fluvialis]|uniref:Uncharacterized protein n=1 Tax=Raineyella fluvialis TaxID=2662261 RepID=A0A5Q2FJH1_9ACTN|nr:hypothetical protein [Raineyella fluvialis]QGF24466.1 hypothetical protein Rai3103_13315 [Raineyella fluvialis]
MSLSRSEVGVLSWVRKALLVLVIAFAVFYLFTNPEGAAGAVRGFFGLFGSIGRFFTALAHG